MLVVEQQGRAEAKSIKIQMQKKLGKTNQVPWPLALLGSRAPWNCSLRLRSEAGGEYRQPHQYSSCAQAGVVLGLNCFQLGCPWLETA